MPKNAGKAAKARKSTHKKNRVAKAVRWAEPIERAPADFDEELEWEIEVRILLLTRIRHQ